MTAPATPSRALAPDDLADLGVRLAAARLRAGDKVAAMRLLERTAWAVAVREQEATA